jgi:hypothetical protein
VEHRTNRTEQLDADLHRRIAARIRRDPGVIAQTRARLAKVMAEEAPHVDPVLREWLDALLMLDPDLISRECDVLFDAGDPLVAVIDEGAAR